MLKRQQKNTLIWAMFGIYLGTFLARALSHPSETSWLSWLLIGAGIVVAIIHYSPDKKE